MAAIGNSPTQQAFTPAIDYFSGNGSTVAFTLSRPVASVAQVQVVIDNVAQNPSSAYTVSSNTITFTSAPLSGTNNIYVYYTSPITQVIAPGQSTVGLTQFTATGTPSASTYLRGDNSWAALAATTPGGSTTQLQYNNAGAFGGISGVTTDGTRMTASTTIGVGAATPSTSGAGITFPATFSNSTNANTLDDYEEGTFTGTMSGGATSPTCTVYYTKIGNQVTVQIVSTGNITSSQIYYRVTGVPAELVPSNSAGVGMVGLVYLSNVAPNYFFGMFICTSTRFDIYYNAAGDNFPTSGTRGMSYLNGTYTTA